MPIMPGMSKMSIGLIIGILGAPFMGGYMARLEADGWEIVGVGHRAQNKVKTMGMLPMPMTHLGMGTVAPTNRYGLHVGSKSMHG